MTIKVNNTDVTCATAADSVRWNRYGAFLSDFSFILELSSSDGITVRSGMEAALYDGETKLWGGVVIGTSEVRRSAERSAVSVKCSGYEHTAARRVSEAVSFSSMPAGAIAEQLFLTYLVNGENFVYSAENFETSGETIPGYSSAGAKLSKLFDDLAQTSGKKWWVREDKSFFFMENIPITDSLYCVDTLMTEANALSDVSALSFSSKSADYRNVQIVFGKDNVKGAAKNNTEIARMSAYGGSGEYANITVNRNILTSESAAAAAASILRSYETNSVISEFSTYTDGLKLFDRIRIRAPGYGFTSFADFVITEIGAKSLPGGKFLYTVTAKYSAPGSASCRPADGWTEQFSQLVNKTDSTVQGSPSGGMKPGDILAGENVTLSRTDSTVTLNAVNEPLLALKAVVFSSGSVTYTLENDEERSYTFGFDSQGELISLIDEEGNVINVSGL